MEREQVERVVYDYMFNSELIKEDLDLLDLRAAGNLFPTIVNKDNDDAQYITFRQADIAQWIKSLLISS